MRLALLPLLLASPLAYAEEGTISGRVVDLRTEPSDQARTRIMLGGGRTVDVLEESGNGDWVRITGAFERGPDTIVFDGWILASQVLREDGRPFGDGQVSTSWENNGEATWEDWSSERATTEEAATSGWGDEEPAAEESGNADWDDSDW